MHCAIANFEFRIFVHDSMLKVDNAVAEIHDWLSPFEVAMSLKCVPFFSIEKTQWVEIFSQGCPLKVNKSQKYFF